MQNESGLSEKSYRLQGKVILLVNGLNERGLVMARKLSELGADVAVTGLKQNPDLMAKMRQEVADNGRFCLIIIPSQSDTKHEQFSQKVIQMILEQFGRLDAFITYSTPAAPIKKEKNGEDKTLLSRAFFDQHGLTKAALEQILA